ncbi:lytic transglycosylase domain-containing protein [sulfur-oxidizing endosymbiont of Gigantopelta aegis]|uniref:lytic transglycosylase domain-containing protein n=1 Tax=sulfur-oxidizing endosymbiont of Gigantopelta aegis TaxID=2794934 RepID=UPI001BE402EE|nr:lytic transglycosylase domain-containing protein [sulfur-oxidizing endosymbiont of Gigantopelta aegis]
MTLSKKKQFLCLLFVLMALHICTIPVVKAKTYQDPIVQMSQAAKNGQITAQVELATAYEHGEGITKDTSKAIFWYCKAALKGSTDAQRNLAWMFLNARGVEQDEALAVRWFNRAAKSGDAYAKKILAQLDQSLQTNKTICIKLPTAYWETKKCTRHCQKTVQLVKEIAPAYNIDTRLVLALIQQESNFKSTALSHKGAMGLMQLMPQTAKRFHVKKVWDPKQNIQGGIRYLSWLLKQYKGDVRLSLAAYNAGEKAVERYKGVPPYKETQNYVRRIIKIYGQNYHPFEKNISMLK